MNGAERLSASANRRVSDSLGAARGIAGRCAPLSRIIGLCLCMASATASCSSTPTGLNEEFVLAALPTWVVGEAADAIGADGRFRLAPPLESAYPTIDAQRAGALASAYVRTFLRTPSTLTVQVEKQHGEDIDFGALRLHERPYFVPTPYEALHDTLPPYTLRAYGSWYLVWFADEGPVLSVAVSAHSTHLRIDADGRVVFPRVYGNEFRTVGTRAKSTWSYPLTPEQAVVHVGRIANVRTVAVPEAYRPAEPFFPQYIYWRLVLEKAVSARRVEDGVNLRTDVLFVLSRGPGSSDSIIKLAVPSVHQPTTEEIFYSPLDEHGSFADSLAKSVIGIRDDRPALFSEVEIIS